jgi:hypothetical protein
MINGKGCHGILCVMKEEERELTNRKRERERACVRGRASEEREVVQRSTD